MWSASWRPLPLGSQASLRRDAALTNHISTVLGDLKSYIRIGNPSEHFWSSAPITCGFRDARATRLSFRPHDGKETGATRNRSGLARWKSTSSAHERARKAIPASELRALSKDEAARIFGKTVDIEKGNFIVRQLQRQRITGTLDHGILAPEAISARALAWLREAHPMDEDAAIIARLDKELEEEDRKTDGAYKPQQDINNSDNYSRSVLDRIKEENKLKAARKKEAKEKEEQAGEIVKRPTSVKTAPRSVVARRTEPAEWIKRYSEKATSKLKEPPKMTKLQRLWPSTVVTLAILGLSALFAQNYHPPPRKARLWPDVPPAAATIFALIGVNVAIFLLWRIPPAWHVLNRQFTLIPAVPYCSSIILNVFSHQSFAHLVTNMAVLWFVGTRLHNDIGRGNFLAIFFACGAFSSYISLSSHVFRSIFYTSSLGASGAICGIIATWLSLDSNKVVFFKVLPDWAGWTPIGILGFMIAIDVFGLTRGLRVPEAAKKVGVDHLAHLGGYAGGLGCAQSLRYQRQQRQQIDEQKKKKNFPCMFNPITAK